MNLSLSGGTAQQRAWVQEALASCTYPYDGLDATVTVTWAPSTPCGTTHTYMCTTDHGDGTFTVTIEDWADDPTNPNLSGLPNPAADIKTFYMQSFIHETGHVAHYTLINTDDLRTQAAALFWRQNVNAGSGKRYGLLADYSLIQTPGLAWADLISEAIAECVKCAFYQGRLVYMNRTNWHVDEVNWAALTAMLSPAVSAGGTQFSYRETFDTDAVMSHLGAENWFGGTEWFANPVYEGTSGNPSYYAMANGWDWIQFVSYSNDPTIFLARSPGSLHTIESFSDADAGVPTPAGAPPDDAYCTVGDPNDWETAGLRLSVDPVADMGATKGTAILGVKSAGQPVTATLAIVGSGGHAG
jgi:hypothetical protein